jgi:hypothetical protein
MLRSLVRSKLSFAPAAALGIALLVAGCGTTLNMHGLDVSDHDGRLFVGGAPVDYHREVSLLGELTGSDLRLVLASPTASIDVVGGPGNTYELVIDLYTEFEDDGGVEFEDGQLSTWSDLKGAVLVNGIRGRLPEGVSLQVQTGTGDVLITSFVSGSTVEVETGTGAVAVNSCDVNRISVDSGTGEVRMTECSAQDVRMKLGVGSLAASNCVVGDFRGDSGTGDFFFQGSRLDNASFVSGVGDVRLTDTLVSELVSTLGTGRVEMRTTVQED